MIDHRTAHLNACGVFFNDGSGVTQSDRFVNYGAMFSSFLSCERQMLSSDWNPCFSINDFSVERP